jgi:hypothetical protein
VDCLRVLRCVRPHQPHPHPRKDGLPRKPLALRTNRARRSGLGGVGGSVPWRGVGCGHGGTAGRTCVVLGERGSQTSFSGWRDASGSATLPPLHPLPLSRPHGARGRRASLSVDVQAVNEAPKSFEKKKGGLGGAAPHGIECRACMTEGGRPADGDRPHCRVDGVRASSYPTTAYTATAAAPYTATAAAPNPHTLQAARPRHRSVPRTKFGLHRLHSFPSAPSPSITSPTSRKLQRLHSKSPSTHRRPQKSVQNSHSAVGACVFVGVDWTLCRCERRYLRGVWGWAGAGTGREGCLRTER